MRRQRRVDGDVVALVGVLGGERAFEQRLGVFDRRRPCIGRVEWRHRDRNVAAEGQSKLPRFVSSREVRLT
jgi:hypothetical protein